MSDSVAVEPASQAVDFKLSVLRHVQYSLGRSPSDVSAREAYQAVSLAVRDRLVERMLETEQRFQSSRTKRVFYLSMEFLIGRSLVNNVINLGLLDVCRSAAADLGFDLSQLEASESDAALGNGGLGRLAACFLDSMATLGVAGCGYGINYEYGLFKQEIRNGEQIERPDNWRRYPNPWEIERPREMVLVPLYGRIDHGVDRRGGYNPMWLDWHVVVGVPHDVPIVGYGGKTVNFLRLYSARASREMDMTVFQEGDYLQAVEQKVKSETISKVLYPSEAAAAGRELRLMQEFFPVACALRDAVRRFQRTFGDRFEKFPDQAVLQLNDTHPALGVAELMRILVDENDMPWEKAWEITSASFAYTNHTLLPEALEKWPTSLLEKVLPRHLQIIYEINRRFMEHVAVARPGDDAKLWRMSIIEEGAEKQVRMAHLAMVGSKSINGVAAVHSKLVQTRLAPDFYDLWPERFNNKTNGVTPRRWILCANPSLARLIRGVIGDQWIVELERLNDLEKYADDSSFQDAFADVKHVNKIRLAGMVRDACAVEIDPESLIDVQVKRIHEYKRQLLNLLHVVWRYLQTTVDGKDLPPRTWVFAGKAAPGYWAAKQVIRAIHDVASIVNGDPRCRDRMKVVFLPDYHVSKAEVIIPAAELSEQISTAGTEASGTGNMKFALNGALTIGTLDGANIEIRDAVGPENMFLFGLTVDEVDRLKRDRSAPPRHFYGRSEPIRRVVDALRNGRFSPEEPARYFGLADRLLADGEPYFHLADLETYVKAQEEVDVVRADRRLWLKKAILNVARTGWFSSDRTIQQYAKEIWNTPASPPKL